MGVGACCLLGCGNQPDATAPVVAAASALASAAAPSAAGPPSAAPVASASTPVASAAPVDAPPTEEEAFWPALALVYDSMLPQCKGGWTGDGEITIKDGKIARFAITYPGAPSKVVPALKGKAVPPVPASLKALLAKPAFVSVCTGGHRPPP